LSFSLLCAPFSPQLIFFPRCPFPPFPPPFFGRSASNVSPLHRFNDEWDIPSNPLDFCEGLNSPYLLSVTLLAPPFSCLLLVIFSVIKPASTLLWVSFRNHLPSHSFSSPPPARACIRVRMRSSRPFPGIRNCYRPYPL